MGDGLGVTTDEVYGVKYDRDHRPPPDARPKSEAARKVVTELLKPTVRTPDDDLFSRIREVGLRSSM